MKWFTNFFNRNTLQNQKPLSEEALRWNRFINEICIKEQSDLTLPQKAAVLSFWYDAEMNSGGHSGYFDCCTKVSSNDLVWALCEVGGTMYVNNFKDAILNGSEDDYVKTDNVFYSIAPSLTDLLMGYIETHSEDIFKNGVLK